MTDTPGAPLAPTPDPVSVRTDGQVLRRAAERAWDTPVVACPDCTAGVLLGHVGVILDWAGRIVSTGETVPRSERVTPPEDRDECLAWYEEQLERTTGILADTPSERATWVFASRGTPAAWWWRRRLAVELAVHRWDAEHALSPGSADPLDPVVAAAGVEEHLLEFLPGLLHRHEGEGISGSLHLHATGEHPVPVEWWVDLDARGDAVAVPEHRHGDVGVRGSVSDLLLWLTNRVPASTLDVVGDAAVAEAFTALRR